MSNAAATSALTEALQTGATVTVSDGYGAATGQVFDHPTEPEAVLVRSVSPGTPTKFYRDDVEEVLYE